MLRKAIVLNRQHPRRKKPRVRFHQNLVQVHLFEPQGVERSISKLASGIKTTESHSHPQSPLSCPDRMPQNSWKQPTSENSAPVIPLQPASMPGKSIAPNHDEIVPGFDESVLVPFKPLLPCVLPEEEEAKRMKAKRKWEPGSKYLDDKGRFLHEAGRIFFCVRPDSTTPEKCEEESNDEEAFRRWTALVPRVNKMIPWGKLREILFGANPTPIISCGGHDFEIVERENFSDRDDLKETIRVLEQTVKELEGREDRLKKQLVDKISTIDSLERKVAELKKQLDPKTVTIANYKEQLYQHYQKEFNVTPQYFSISEEGSPHMRTFIEGVRSEDGSMVGRGISRRKQDAQQLAAKDALQFFGLI